MADLDPVLQQLSQAYDIATDYWDWQGQHVVVSEDTIVAVLAALDVDASTPERAQQALEESVRDRWRKMLPPLLATRQSQPASIPVHVTHGDPVTVWIEEENGETRHDVQQQENWAPPQTSVIGGSERPPSPSPPTCRWATTRCAPEVGTSSPPWP